MAVTIDLRVQGVAQLAAGLRSLSGPFQQLERARANLVGAAGSGSSSRMADAQLAFQRAQERVNRSQQGTAHGAEAAAGGLGKLHLAAVAVVGAFGPFLAALQGAQARFEALTQTGGTAGQTAALSAFGISPGRQAALAAGLRERLAAGGPAAAEGARLGLGIQLPRPFGAVNEASLLLKAVERLRSLQGNPEQQLRAARLFGMEGELSRINVGGAVRQRQDTLLGVGSRVLDQGTLRQVNDLTESFRLLGEMGGAVLMQWLKPFLPVLKDLTLLGVDAGAGLVRMMEALRPLADVSPLALFLKVLRGVGEAFRRVLSGGTGDRLLAAFQKLAQAFEPLGRVIEANVLPALVHMIEVLGPGFFKALATGITTFANAVSALLSLLARFGLLKDGGAGQGAGNSALDANTKALMDNTRVLREGTFGGGARARFAAGMSKGNAYHFNASVVGGALRLGAFGAF